MGPLGHLRVLDLSPTRIGAQVSQLFADFGADVIWVEPPGGAPIRREAGFPFWCRGKRSIVLDLHDRSDQDVVRSLAASADVLVETFVPGELEGLGLGYHDLASVNPGLVYASVTAFGRQGPCTDVPVDQDLVLATLGVNHVFRRMSNRDAPPYVTVPFAAFAASQVALHGVLAALIERDRSGLGQWVEANLAQSFTTLDTWAWFEHLITDRWPEAYTPSASYDDDGRPASPLTFMLLVALTADGAWLQFAAVAPHLFAAKMKALGLAWMFTDEEWKGLPLLADADKRMDLWNRMLEAAKAKTLAEWEQIFENDHDVFAEQFRRGAGGLDHPQLLHDGMVTELVDTERGPVRQPGALVKAAATPATIDRSAPTLDEHRDAILAEACEPVAAPDPPATDPPATDAPAPDAPRGLPLDGVTIVELAVLFAAPHGTTMLTDLGARVIKIEPMTGDMIRNIIPFPESGGAKVMQGKDSICIDLGTPEGVAIARELVRRADVVIQGFRAGAVQRLGLDYASVSADNPDVIYVNAPGYGVDGPYGDRPAYAPSIGAASGIPLTNVGESVPELPDLTLEQIRDGARRLSAGSALANAQADGFAALGVATAILFGLAARDAGAGGQELFSSMLNTGGHAMSANAVTYPGAPPGPAPDADLRGQGPLRRIHPTADGYVMLAADGEGEWERLAAALGSAADVGADGDLGSTLEQVFASRPATQWQEDLLARGIGCVAVHQGSIESKLWDDSFGRASGYLVDVVHPTFDEHPRLAPYVRFSRSATQALPGVLAGQATDAVLEELGRGPEAIADLRQRKIVG